MRRGSTPSPTDSITPAPSQPMEKGAGTMPGYCPRVIHNSRWLSAAALMATNTSPAFGLGVSMFLTTAHCRPSVASKTNAFINTLRTSLNGLQRVKLKLGLHFRQQRQNRHRGRCMGVETSIDRQQLAGDEARSIGCQKQHHLGNVSRLAQPPNQFIVAEYISQRLGHHRLQNRCGDQTE